MLPTFKKPEFEPRSAPNVPPPQPSSTLGTRMPVSPLRAGGGGAPSVIGPDLLINGNLVSKGAVQIDGEVQGDIHGTHIIVGEKAKITGGIVAEEVVVRGHVAGSIRGKRVLLQTSSHVEGDIYHQTLAIEQGAFFEGKSRRTEDPIAGIGSPTQQLPRSSPPAAAAPARMPEPTNG